jgi:hypothetical protein
VAAVQSFDTLTPLVRKFPRDNQRYVRWANTLLKPHLKAATRFTIVPFGEVDLGLAPWAAPADLLCAWAAHRWCARSPLQFESGMLLVAERLPSKSYRLALITCTLRFARLAARRALA